MFRGERRILLLGALVGGLVGGLAALIYARQMEEGEPGRRGLEWRQVARLTALAVGLLRQIAEMGQR